MTLHEQNIVNTDYLQNKKSIPLALLSCLSYNKLFANKIEKKNHELFYTANAIHVFEVRCEINVFLIVHVYTMHLCSSNDAYYMYKHLNNIRFIEPGSM